ncbi:MAG TPA: hypothetical protein VKF41_06460 [Bryobacteraceae bacterium]|nr:hypothetical protein [Bryobacteraceae bacterium]
MNSAPPGRSGQETTRFLLVFIASAVFTYTLLSTFESTISRRARDPDELLFAMAMVGVLAFSGLVFVVGWLRREKQARTTGPLGFGVLAAVLVFCPISYAKYILPKPILEVADTGEYLLRMVSVEGSVKSAYWDGKAGFFEVGDQSGGTIMITPIGLPPKVGQTVWVLGRIGHTRSGIANAMTELRRSVR